VGEEGGKGDGGGREEWQDYKQEEVGVEVEEGLEKEEDLRRTSHGSLLPMAILSEPGQS